MATFTVINDDDSGAGSLRQAIVTANLDPEPDLINFDLTDFETRVITLSDELVISTELSIEGPGASELTISGGGISRIFNVVEPEDDPDNEMFFNLFVNISGLTLTDGSEANGGAILNDGATVFLTDMTVTGNKAVAEVGNADTGRGGGIYTKGEDFGGSVETTAASLYVFDSRITDNDAVNGGGIYNEKDHVELIRSVVDGNTASGDGGGVYTVGEEFSGYGGGNDTLIVDDSQINGNRAVNGGGIYNEKDHVELRRSVVSGNIASGDGGGVYTLGQEFSGYGGGNATLIVNDSQINGNSALNGRGGGIHNNSDTLRITRSTIDGNRAAEGGGLFQSNPAANSVFSSIDESTFSNNRAIATGAFVGRGGGISVANAQLYVANSTLSGNAATEDGGGLYVGAVVVGSGVDLIHVTIAGNQGASGGGIYHDNTGDVRLNNSLVATNNAADNSDDVWGDFDPSSSFNLIGNSDGSTGFLDENGDPANGNQVGDSSNPINPLIGPLQDNGGPTLTHALLVGSPAIDATDNSFFVFFDQRGLRRGNAHDLGAYERAFDFGDAPSTFPTTLPDGARHVIGALRLGGQIDSEDNGQPSNPTFANRDDDDFIDDEDGVQFRFLSVAGFTGAVEVESNGAGFINAWLDVDGIDGWEPDEQILTNVAVVAGLNVLTYNIPAPPANSGITFTAIARFRLNSTGGLGTDGEAADGEVEDYAMTISRVILPNGGGEGFTFTERVPPRVPRPYDPDIAYGYDYVVNPGGDNFTAVELLSGFGDDLFTLQYKDVNGDLQTVPLAAPVIFNFETEGGVAGGVSEFRVFGIELSEGLDPDDPTAFPTGLAFGDADNNDEAVVDFTMTPLASPVANDDEYSVDEDGVLTVPSGILVGVLANDTDRNLDTLNATLITDVSHGTLTLNPDGSFDYTPVDNFNGTDSFTYLANDGLSDSDPATVTIIVNAENDQPTASNGGAVSTNQGTSVEIDLQPLVADVETADGDLIYNPSVSASSGTLVPVVGQNGKFTFSPAPGFTGDATITFSVEDTGDPIGTPGNALTSNAATFIVTVIPVVTVFSFVDANNNKVFDAGDVALVRGEVADGFFDTRHKEGGYTTVIRGAGLVIAGAPIAGHDLTYRADGDLVVNTNLTAGDDLLLASRGSSVQLDDPHLTAVGAIQILAWTDIISTDDILEATGPHSRIDLLAGRDIALLGTRVSAVKKVDLVALRNLVIGDSSANQGLVEATHASQGGVVLLGGSIDVSGAALRAGDDVNLATWSGDIVATDANIHAGDDIVFWSWSGDLIANRAVLQAGSEIDLNTNRGHINVDFATLIAGHKIGLDTQHGHISADGALLLADREIGLEASRGTVSARGSLLNASGAHGEVELSGKVIDISVLPSTNNPTVVIAKREIKLTAVDRIMADNAFLKACDGRVEIGARNDISLKRSVVRALHEIKVTSSHGNVDLIMADLAICGGTKGDINVKGKKLFINGAAFTAPDKINLQGQKVGTATFTVGTKPC